ncbi:MAG: SDR family oxidoreductase [Lachnospiraceae bacterium]
MLRGKNAIITGANRGIGNAIMKIFAKNGANIWACARSENEQFESEIEELSKTNNVWIKPIYFDLSKEDEIKRGFKEIIKEKQPIDILVNNAGTIYLGLYQMTPIQVIRDIYNINVLAPMQLTQLVLRIMSRQRAGSIINIGSAAGKDITPGNCTYGSSKAALIHWSQILAAETAPGGIRVNVIAPGNIDTGMLKESKDKAGDNLLQKTAMNRLGTPAEVANVALFLASDQSSYINGEVIRVDGGRK